MAEYCFKLIREDRGDKSVVVEMAAEYHEVTISPMVNGIAICTAGVVERVFIGCR